MTTSNAKIHHDTRHRIPSSKRTMMNNLEQTIDQNLTTKTHRSARLSKPKHNCEISNLKPESGSEEVYTAPLNNEGIKISSSITQKHRTRQEGIGDYIHEDADEESSAIRAIMTKTKTPIEHIHRLSSPSNNSAIRLQQQGMGDHYHHNTKQQKSRRHHHELDDGNIYRWRLFMYILTIVILAFVIYRFLMAIWPKRKKTFLEQLVDDLSNFFTS
jgi:hypothetical protein